MRWLTISRTTVLVLVPTLGASTQAADDPVRGADIFRQSCSACHSVEPGQNLVGPSLFSVVGRPPAGIAGFSYSSAMKSSGIVWTTDELKAYLRGPRKYLPGVKMMFPGLADEQDRENVVSYLETLRAASGSSDAIATQASKATRGSE